MDHTARLLAWSLALYGDDSTNFLQDAPVIDGLALSKLNTPHFLSAGLGVIALTYSAEFPILFETPHCTTKTREKTYNWTHCTNPVHKEIQSTKATQKHIEPEPVF